MSQLEFGNKFLQSTIVGSRHIGNFVAIPLNFSNDFLLFLTLSFIFINIQIKIRIFYHLIKWLCLNFNLIPSCVR